MNVPHTNEHLPVQRVLVCVCCSLGEDTEREQLLRVAGEMSYLCGLFAPLVILSPNTHSQFWLPKLVHLVCNTVWSQGKGAGFM